MLQNPIHTPNKSIIKAQIDNETYFITTDKNNITAIEKQELQNLAQPKTYDELMQRDKNENATLESYRDQYADIAEIKEAQAQKQLLLEYKPEVAKADGNASAKDTFTDKQGNTHNIKDFANSLHTQAKEQENHFKGFLQSLKTEANTIIDTHITKSIESIESKIRRKNGNTDDMADFLRASILVDTNKDLDTQLLNLVNALEKQGIRPNIELKHRTSGYKGLHLQFEFNGIKSEIQLHTKQGWEIKKKQDEIYQVLRENALKQTLSEQEYLELEAKSVKLGQANDFSIKDFASFELNLMVSSNSETSVLRTKSEALANLNQPPSLNSKLASSEPDIAYNRLDSTLSVKDNLSTGSGNKSLESIQNPLINNNEIIPQTTQEIIKQAKQSGKSVKETKELLQQHKDIESKRKETQKLITQEKKAKEKLHKEIGIFEKEQQNSLEKLESIKTQINELEKQDLSSKQAQKQMDKLQTNLSFFANEIEKTRNLIKQRKDKLATTQEVYIPQNHTFSYDGREFNTREHFSILKQRSLNNQDDDFNGFDTLMREAIENALNIKPIKEFGTNYAEHYHSGETAIQKLISEAQAHKESGAKGEYKGQVAGAFHRKELGDIDLVWGEVEGKGKEAKGWGLAKIIEKHGDEFSSFSGNTEEQKLINGINEIIQNGKLLTENGVNTLYLQKDNKVFLVGLSKGWDKKGENQWIITSYEANNLSPDILEKIGANKTFPADESLNALQTFNATDNSIIPQK